MPAAITPITGGVSISLADAAYHIAGIEKNAARAVNRLHHANQLQPLPEGALDLVEDIERLRATAARLNTRMLALCRGEAVPR